MQDQGAWGECQGRCWDKMQDLPRNGTFLISRRARWPEFLAEICYPKGRWAPLILVCNNDSPPSVGNHKWVLCLFSACKWLLNWFFHSGKIISSCHKCVEIIETRSIMEKVNSLTELRKTKIIRHGVDLPGIVAVSTVQYRISACSNSIDSNPWRRKWGCRRWNASRAPLVFIAATPHR